MDTICWIQAVPSWLHVFTRIRWKSELWLHEFRHLRLGFIIRLSSNDARLLGKSVPVGSKIGRSMAHVVLHRDHFSWLLLSRQLDSCYCRHVLRWIAEESWGRGGSRGGSYKSTYLRKIKIFLESTYHSCSNKIDHFYNHLKILNDNKYNILGSNYNNV